MKVDGSKQGLLYSTKAPLLVVDTVGLVDLGQLVNSTSTPYDSIFPMSEVSDVSTVKVLVLSS